MQGVSPVWSWGAVPKRHKVWCVRVPRNATQVMGRNYRCILESVELAEGERPGAHVAIKKKRTPLHTPYKARRCCSYPPDRRGRRVTEHALRLFCGNVWRSLIFIPQLQIQLLT